MPLESCKEVMLDRRCASLCPVWQTKVSGPGDRKAMVGRRRMTVIVRAKEANGYVERATEIRGKNRGSHGIENIVTVHPVSGSGEAGCPFVDFQIEIG